jgi:hypothetical protein
MFFGAGKLAQMLVNLTKEMKKQNRKKHYQYIHFLLQSANVFAVLLSKNEENQTTIYFWVSD